MLTPGGGNWFHCVITTYGTWLPGDPRGFRTRHHREHIQGDYKNPPPPGLYNERHRHAKAIMKRDRVVLLPEARRVALRAIHHALVEVHGAEVLAIAVCATHAHLLARFPVAQTEKPTPSRGGRDEKIPLKVRDPARYYIGIAKERSSKALIAQGLAQPGGVWAKRSHSIPIQSHDHQRTVFTYITHHAREGAHVWTFRDHH